MFSPPLKKSIVFLKYALKMDLVKGAWFDLYVRYSEGAEMYHMSVSKFMQMAKDAKAIYKLGQLVLVNLKIFDEYIETFHIVDDEFYK